MEKKRSKHFVGSILCSELTAFGIVAVVISLISGNWVVDDCINLLLLFLIIFYAFIGYKKPHGNLLKYNILLYAALRLVFLYQSIIQNVITNTILLATEIGLLCYVGGRLAKFKENLILMIIVTAIEVYILVSGFVVFSMSIGAVSGLIIWLDICVAYFHRYKEHREAGLQDAPKK